ncbi:hypothetical protein FRC10_009805 [Ceratobasidium sp. 414]|nr:hypothetical protein FRC10_009805 [Ceratobasidium sp. 414]
MLISQQQIKEHTRLLNSLSALDYVPTAQEDNDARLEVVRREVSVKERELAALEKKTKSEYKDTQKLNSSIRRLMIRIRDGGKDAVTQRVQKEEAEYIEAYRQEREARDELDMLIGERNEREIASIDLFQKAQTIKDCKEKIDALYQGLFSGPTPDYPEEEEAERRFGRSKGEYTSCQVQLNNETTALTKLVNAEKALRICVNKLRDVQMSTTQSPLGLGGDWSEILVNVQLSSALLDATMVKKFLRDAEACVGRGVIGSVGEFTTILSLAMIREYSTEIIDNRYVRVPLPNLTERVEQNIQNLQQCHTRLAGELDSCHARISDHQSRLKHYARNMQTLRKELAKVRCEIMLRMTDPATIHPQTHRSAANAIEVGDTELPMYDESSPIAGSSSSPTNLNRAASRSFAVPTYEEARAQAKPAGGFRIALEGANDLRNQVPDYAPPGIGSAPGGIGGFRVAAASNGNNVPSRSPLSLKIPEPQVKGSTSRASSPCLAPASPLTPGASPTSAGASTPRPTSWSLNPYAAAMIRQASLSESEPALPGAWSGSADPFAALMSEEPHQDAAK